MNRKKLVVLAIEDNKKIKERKVNPQINLNTEPTNKKNTKKIVLSVAILGIGAYLYFNQGIIKDFIGNSPKVDNGFMVINGEKDKTTENKEADIPVVNLNKANTDISPVNKELAEAVKKKEAIEKMVDEELPTLSLNQPKNDEVAVTTKDDLPIVNINSKTNQMATPPSNNNTISDEEILKKELSMLLKNSTFNINAKKDNISLFINNINYNIGDAILNNNKFKLKDITMICDNDSLPSFKFNITDTQGNNTLFTKELKYSDNRKITLSFDSLSILDLDNNIENIYMPNETIFKDFKLNSINENGYLLNFNFTCQNKKITISGAELSAIQ